MQVDWDGDVASWVSFDDFKSFTNTEIPLTVDGLKLDKMVGKKIQV